MSDDGTLQKQVQLSKRITALTEENADIRSKCVTLEDRLAAVSADAERYRWIREHGDEVCGDDCKGHQVDWVRKYGDRNDQLDTRIDAARAASEGNEGKGAEGG